METLSVICSNCKTKFQKPIYYIKQGQKRGYLKHFCSNICSVSFNRNLQEEYKKKRIEKYYKNPDKCPNCKSVLNYGNKKTYCSSTCAATYTQKNGGNHRWSEEEKKKQSILAKQNPDWIKHHPKIGIYKKCSYSRCDDQMYVTPSQNKHCCSKQCLNKWIKESDYYKNKGRGGFRANSGTSKKGWYKGYFCGSSWELAWVIYHLEHNISFKRNKEGFDYKFKGKNKKYYPDFILSDSNEYIEIKNYTTEQVIEKVKQFPHKLKVLYKNDLCNVFKYVQEKYGKDFIRLYQKKN